MTTTTERVPFYTPSSETFEPESTASTLPEQLRETEYQYDHYWEKVGKLSPELAQTAQANQRYVERVQSAILGDKLVHKGADMQKEAHLLYLKLGTFNHMRGSQELLLKMHEVTAGKPEYGLFSATVLHEAALVTDDTKKQGELFKEAEAGYQQILRQEQYSQKNKAQAFKQLFDIRFYRLFRHARELQERELSHDSPEWARLKEVYKATALDQVYKALVLGKNIGNGRYLELVALAVQRQAIFDNDALADIYVRAAFEREDDPTDSLGSDEFHKKHLFDMVVERVSTETKDNETEYYQLKAHDRSEHEYIDGITDVKIPRQEDESDTQYNQRIRNLLVRTLAGIGREYTGAYTTEDHKTVGQSRQLLKVG